MFKKHKCEYPSDGGACKICGKTVCEQLTSKGETEMAPTQRRYGDEKICVNCVHHELNDNKTHECHRGKGDSSICLVTGEMVENNYEILSCSRERGMNNDSCGPIGRFYKEINKS